jgi:hypothetical protein
VPTGLTSGQYAIEIEDDSGNINYSVQFAITGDGTGQSATGPTASTAATAAAASSEEPATTILTVTGPSTLTDVFPTSAFPTETEVTPSEAPITVSETEAATLSDGEYCPGCMPSDLPFS